MNIYVSNLAAHVKNEDLRALFARYGEVQSAEITMDAFTDRSRGFAYVEMRREEEARQAIAALHESQLNGYVISVQEAQPKKVQRGSYKVGNGAVNTYRFKKT